MFLEKTWAVHCAWLTVRRQDCKKRSAESALVTLPARPLVGLLNKEGVGRLISLLNFLCSVKIVRV